MQKYDRSTVSQKEKNIIKQGKKIKGEKKVVFKKSNLKRKNKNPYAIEIRK